MTEKNNISNSLDELIKSKLDSASIPPPANAWNGIAQQLDLVHSATSTTQLSKLASKFGNKLFVKVAITTLSIATVSSLVLLTQRNNEKVSYPNNEENNYSNDTISNVIQIDTLSTFRLDSNVYANEKNNKFVFETEKNSNENALQTDRLPVNPTIHTPTNSSQKTAPTAQLIATESPLNIENSSKIEYVLNDTQWCGYLLPTPSAFLKNKNISNSAYLDAKGNKISATEMATSFLKSHSQIIVSGQNEKGEWVKRKIQLAKSKTPEVKLSNAGPNKVYAQLETTIRYESILWKVDEEIVDEDINYIVYNRNFESTQEKSMYLKVYTSSHIGCIDSVQYDIAPYMYEEKEPVIPNVFTPNSDGLNDVFEILISGESYYKLKVLGQNNVLLFESTDKNNTWKGTDRIGEAVPEGSYFFLLEYAFNNGKVKAKSGIVQVIRN